MSLDAFSESFGVLKDPRQTAKITYPLFDILFLTVCAIIASAEGWEDIEDFGEAHLDWFQDKGLFPNGLPVHDTIARIISALDPAEFQQCFIHWAQSVNERTGSKLIAIDGKTLRGSYNREDRRSAIHMVSAFAVDNKVVMGQLKTEEKSNEIKAIPALLSLLDINGCLVSIDAMGCQTRIAEAIINQGGDYLLAVKDNQERLQRAVQRELRPVHSAGTNPDNVTIEQGHGRIEAREYHVLPADALLDDFPEWTGIKTLGVAIG
ncbi:putative transposase YbfD/YdcC [Oceanisphaera litoralis]|nr:putative transposase YbfD/YdcC [Oceanisphaera litoralis]